jgi:DNA-binding protein HU-beta
MAPMKTMKATKAMKAGGKAMTKGALVKMLAEQHEMKTKACSVLFDSLAALATTEVKKTGIFTIPGLCRIKTRVKPATKAGVRMAFGKEMKVKAKPAKTVVKAFPVAALKKQI